MFAIRSNLTGVELQDDLMRFEGRFSSRLTTAFAPLVESEDPAIRLRAARDELNFMSAALDIAVSSSPEVDLLDMVTLVALGNDAMASRWSPATYGDEGRAVVDAFTASLDDVSEVARGIVSDEGEGQLKHVIHEWQEENPTMEDVASVRLSAYAEHRGSSQLAKEATGLFSVVRGAAKTADTAVLLGERALYLAQRMPFLVRIHARIATQELLSDVAAMFTRLIERVALRVR